MRNSNEFSLTAKYPPSKPCSCDICTGYCKRPGWWTVDEARMAIRAGYANRMMLEISPEHDFYVLSPAFYGCEQNFALQEYSHLGCNFLVSGLCELHGTGFEPLECRFCHHTRMGEGTKCHLDIEQDWHTNNAQELVYKWLIEYGYKIRGFFILK